MIVKTDPDQFQNYLSDASNYKGDAQALYIPEDAQELADLIKSLNQSQTRVTISGNGTGLTGSRVPEGGVIVSLEKLNNILQINEIEKYVVAESGVILKDLQDFVEAKNLFYPPDPTERNCFIGGTVATNASGARSFKYGATRNFVLAITVVLPSGDIIEIERGKNIFDGIHFSLRSNSDIQLTLPNFRMPQTKNASGYYCSPDMDLIDLFIGSEGTLGIITKVKLKLLDMPSHTISCVTFFNDETDALNFIDESRELSLSGNIISPRGLEFFDENALNFLRPDYPNIDTNVKCAVWFEQETNDDELLDEWIKLINKHNASEEVAWLAIDKNEQDKFKDFRHAISWKVNEFVASRGLRKVGTDVSVPQNSFREFYFWMKRTVENNGLDYVVYGHFGDCHPHLNMLPKNQEQFAIARQVYSQICKEAVRLKGTVSAEHGIGKAKREYLLMMYGQQVISEMAKLKVALDNNKILNIGNIFEERFL